MIPDVVQREAGLRREADELLGPGGLYGLLARYGEPHVDGSYALQLMAWRDLDIYLVAEDMPVTAFFELGGRLAEILHPVRMSFRNERVAGTPGLLHGLYWGVYLGNEREVAWKIDVWAIPGVEYARLSKARFEIAQRLTAELWQDQRYRKDYCSMDIYRAVLDDGVSSISQFSRWLQVHKGIGMPRS